MPSAISVSLVPYRDDVFDWDVKQRIKSVSESVRESCDCFPYLIELLLKILLHFNVQTTQDCVLKFLADCNHRFRLHSFYKDLRRLSYRCTSNFTGREPSCIREKGYRRLCYNCLDVLMNAHPFVWNTLRVPEHVKRRQLASNVHYLMRPGWDLCTRVCRSSTPMDLSGTSTWAHLRQRSSLVTIYFTETFKVVLNAHPVCKNYIDSILSKSNCKCLAKYFTAACGVLIDNHCSPEFLFSDPNVLNAAVEFYYTCQFLLDYFSFSSNRQFEWAAIEAELIEGKRASLFMALRSFDKEFCLTMYSILNDFWPKCEQQCSLKLFNDHCNELNFQTAHEIFLCWEIGCSLETPFKEHYDRRPTLSTITIDDSCILD